MGIQKDLILLLRKVDRVVALTGAGISQESGLQTFRDTQTGLWSQFKPTELATPEAFMRNPKLVWDWYAMRRNKVSDVEPNPGHFAIVEIAGHIPDFSLITQNVDGLHQRAGSPKVIELHGNIQRVKCSSCGQQAQAWNEAGDEVPKCEICKSLLRPDVVWFGESLPYTMLEAAEKAARACQVYFSIGTSGVVHPAASLALTASARGALIVEINTESTPLTEKADYYLQGMAGEILPALVKSVWG
ncbi:MAG: NAD-dependent deacylase [Anaerolineae bacterium]|nr:NAD-dependent deacylase [Anaerolineae bacterium]